MATWYLEHVATSDKRTLSAWGFESAQVNFVNWGVDTLQLVARAEDSGTAAPIWDYLDKVILWRDTTRIMHAWVTTAANSAEAATSAQPYTLAGAGWWMANTPFSDTYQEPSGTSTVSAAISRAISRTRIEGTYLSGYNGHLNGICPQPPTGQTCISAMQAAARYSPLSCGWWDYSGTTPVFNAVERADWNTATLSLSTGSVEAWRIAPRPDLVVAGVRIAYTYPDPTTGVLNYTFSDSAGTSDESGSLYFIVNSSDQAAAMAGAGAGIAHQIYAPLSVLCWEGALQIHECTSAIPLILPGTALNLTGGQSAWATMAALVQQSALSITASSTSASITFGLPEQLGLQDFMEIYRIGGGASGGAGGRGPEYWPQPPRYDDIAPEPGTIGELGEDGIAMYSPAGSMAFQAKGGTATLVGYDENTGFVSSPPRKFRSCSASGSITSTINGVPEPTQWATDSGTAHISDAGGNDSGITIQSNFGTASYTRAGMGGVGSVDFCGARYSTSAASAYFVPRDYPPAAMDDGQSSWMVGVNSYVGSGQLTESLSDEDTDTAAKDRMLAAATWGTSTVTQASWAPRATGFSFACWSIRFRPTEVTGKGYGLTGGKPWWPYSITANLEQIAIGDGGTEIGSWASISPIVRTSQADLDGFVPFPDWIEVTAEKGYKVRISSIDYSAT